MIEVVNVMLFKLRFGDSQILAVIKLFISYYYYFDRSSTMDNIIKIITLILGSVFLRHLVMI